MPDRPYVRLSRFAATLSAILALPYWKRRLFLWHRIEPREPRFLYKYRLLDVKQPDTLVFTRDIIVGSRLWLSSPRDFNDPFDMTADVVYEGTLGQRRARIKKLVKERS